MPFVTQDHRNKPDLSIAGDLCYIYYRWIKDAWNVSQRWTTADAIFGRVLKLALKLLLQFRFRDFKALLLAWAVFFCLHVMDYEQKKRGENGDII